MDGEALGLSRGLLPIVTVSFPTCSLYFGPQLGLQGKRSFCVRTRAAENQRREGEVRLAALERILAAHEGFFDIQRNYAFAQRTFPGYGEFHAEASRYVLAKRAKLWEVSAHEYLFFLEMPHLDKAAFDDAVAFITKDALEKVQLSANHMTSYLSLVIVADTVEEGVLRAVRKTRFRKNFCWGIKGWADVRLAVVDLSCGLVETNAMGKELRATLEANAFRAA